ncbi:MAG TPA: glycoside hydrolase family 6 protein [Solirubrobacteraceae bacterium]|nr:glycoside hydrolase family 6 protein [Solirubrobacteraceae bacterium]
MTRFRLVLCLVLTALSALLLAPSGALADAPTPGVPICSPVGNPLNGLSGGLGLGGGTDRGTIGFAQSSYTADEAAGEFWLTITRTATSGVQIIWYGVKQHTAQSPWDFTAVPNTEATLVPGQASCQFPVTIADNGMNGPAIDATAYLYGSNRAALAADPLNVTLTILRNDPLAPRDPANPLGLSPAPVNGDPISGAQFYVAPYEQTGAGMAFANAFRSGDLGLATALKFIADQPTGYRFWLYNTPADPAPNVARYLENAQYLEPGKVVELSTYSLVHAPCGSTANPAFTSRYLDWIRGLAQGIGNFRVVMFFELDSIITSPCLTPAQRHERLVNQLKPAIQILEAADPHLVLYLDAGAQDAVSARLTARWLREAGVLNAQGFFVNSTHFQWDTTEVAWGQQVSRLLGGHVHFLVSSGPNGRGPKLNPHPMYQGVEDLCNPPGRGLGTMSTQTGFTNVDGFLWFAPVGNSGGSGRGCGAGAPATSKFWPAYAEMLYRNRYFGISGPPRKLERDGTFVPYSAAFAL